MHQHEKMRLGIDRNATNRDYLNTWASQNLERSSLVDKMANELVSMDLATWCLTLASTAEASAAIEARDHAI